MQYSFRFIRLSVHLTFFEECVSSKPDLLIFREENSTYRGQKLYIYKGKTCTHCVVADNLSILGSQLHATKRTFRKILRTFRVDDYIGVKSDFRFSLHNFNVFSSSIWKDLGDNIDIFATAEDDNIVLINLDQSLYNKLLKKVGVVLSTRDQTALGTSFLNKCLEQFVTDAHLTNSAFSELGGAGNTFLDLTVLLLLREFVLDGELCLVNKSLLFEVEIVLSLCVLLLRC